MKIWDSVYILISVFQHGSSNSVQDSSQIIVFCLNHSFFQLLFRRHLKPNPIGQLDISTIGWITNGIKNQIIWVIGHFNYWTHSIIFHRTFHFNYCKMAGGRRPFCHSKMLLKLFLIQWTCLLIMTIISYLYVGDFIQG